ncbi:MAG: DUF3137 domain-containing protein [Flavobacteriales bacterium]
MDENLTPQFDSFYEQQLLPVLQQLEQKRKTIVRSIILLIVLFFSINLMGVFLSIAFYSVVFLFIFLAVSVVVSMIFYFNKINKEYASFKDNFKKQVIKLVIDYVQPGLNYNPSGFLSQTEFKKSRIITSDFNRYKGNDYISGKIVNTDVELSELLVQKEVKTKNGSSTHTIFKGVFFIADFHKKFRAETYVLTDTLEKTFGSLGTWFQKNNFGRPALVKLENLEFEKHFAVYSTDQIEARYILTPKMMEAILDLKKLSNKVQLSFLDEKVYIKLPLKKDMLESAVFKTVIDKQEMKSNYTYLKLLFSIVDILDLNTRIWTKA